MTSSNINDRTIFAKFILQKNWIIFDRVPQLQLLNVRYNSIVIENIKINFWFFLLKGAYWFTKTLTLNDFHNVSKTFSRFCIQRYSKLKIFSKYIFLWVQYVKNMQIWYQVNFYKPDLNLIQIKLVIFLFLKVSKCECIT